MTGERVRSAYRIVAAAALLGGLPIFVLGAGFAGGFGSALNSFRSGLAAGSPLNWFFLLPLILLPIYWWLGRAKRAEATRLPWKMIIGGACLFSAVILLASVRDTPVAALPSACHRGAYKLEDGRVMAVTVSPVAALNARLSDGGRAMTWTGDHFNFSGVSCFGGGRMVDDFSIEAPSCRAAALRVDTHDAPPQSALRIPIVETSADFSAGGVDFRARLFTPPGHASIPLVVLPASRSGVSNLDWGHEQYLLSGLGVAVFVYDKPEKWPYGHSKIGNDRDAITYARVAFERARTVMGERILRAGFYGGRDALLAASHVKTDFVVADAVEVDSTLLGSIRVPVLLLTPGGDRDVPAARIVQTVQQLRSQGRLANVLVFSSADKYMVRYETRAGERCQAGEPKSYFPSIVEWIASGDIKAGPDAQAFPG